MSLSNNQKQLIGSAARSWITRKRYARLLINHENRDKVAKEIFETEQLYVRNLEIIVQYYLKPLKTIQPPLLSPKSIQCIFGHIEDLLTVNRELLCNIQDRMTTWKDNKKLGDIFLKLAPFLKMYTEYCSNYDKAVTKLKQKADLSKDLALFLKKINSESAFGLDLTSLLIMPVQRIPRYKMLLQSLIQLTPKEFSDYKVIEEALHIVSGVADHVNEGIREKQNSEKILSIQRRFTGYVPPLLAPLRTFIREGYLTKVCRKEPKKRWFILFSDAILYGNKIETTVANPIYKFHRLLELSKTKIVHLDDKDAKHKNSFQIIHTSKSFTVFADNDKEKATWLMALDTQIKFLSQNEGISVARMNRQYSNIKILKAETDESTTQQASAPVWIPDSDANQCMECGIKFTAIRRRHHCRRCGILVCGKCSDQSWKLDNAGKPVRVCRSCYSYLSMTTSRRNEAAASTSSSTPGSLETSSSTDNLSSIPLVGDTTSTINEESGIVSSDSDYDDYQDQASATSDSLTEIPSITLPPLPSSSTTTTQRSLSPFSSPMVVGSNSMTQLPSINNTNNNNNNNNYQSSHSMSALPPLPSSVNLPPPVVLPTIPSTLRESSPPPQTQTQTQTTTPPTQSPAIPTTPPPTLYKQNSLLSFCNLVITQNPNVEAAGFKKKPSTSGSSSPATSPIVDRKNTSTSSTIVDPSSISLPGIKTIHSPDTNNQNNQNNQNQNTNNQQPIVINNNNQNNQNNNNNNTVENNKPSTKPNVNSIQVLPNSLSSSSTPVVLKPTSQQPPPSISKLPPSPSPIVLKPTPQQPPPPTPTTTQKPTTPLPTTPLPSTPKELPTKSLPPIPPVPKKSLPPLPPPTSTTINNNSNISNNNNVITKTTSAFNLIPTNTSTTTSSPPPIPPKRAKSSLQLGPTPPIPTTPTPTTTTTTNTTNTTTTPPPPVGQHSTENPPPLPPRRTVK
ncbi:pleckstrin domain-containing protein [Cavenderia fasciculata]|uniref:Pleckstrin domain-containing protein n=1 Tax=Cavenderia fasciculata TaxID=261658 RepID=F4PUH8_CACFS|nr:pleckstrin domain-containing protein [Cavenderia fasciculata]EGG21050.1 pleckstrin domain-containing protein [Cavenderia fasciculata]|eukprot:XP_004358900.1 pleckstrin domain-containing protein [Cavenderia fasciculata]